MRLIRTGQVRVDGGRPKPFQRMAAGQMVRIPPRLQREADSALPALAAGPLLDVVHESEGVLAVAKPAGLPSHGGDGHTDSAVARVRAMRPGPFAATPVHRLDKSTSGLLVFAKSYKAMRELQEAFKTGAAQKRYLAWTAGHWPFQGEVELRDILFSSGPAGRERVRVAADGAAGREAVCVVSPVRRGEAATLLEVLLLTGRKHQIRVQLASRGHPVMGDGKYGGPPCPQGLLLHAWRITLPGGVPLRLAPDWDDPFRP
jgi:23S rRNA pseudouridine955/2504/2580 synthase